MGWFWSSSAASPNVSRDLETGTAPAESPLAQTSSTPSSIESPSNFPRQRTRDEIAESQLRSLIEELGADVQPSSSKYNRMPRPPSQQSRIPTPSNLTLEEQLLPTEMSCRQAFDAAFYCQSLGGQFNNLYRYGSIRSCSENWNDFWFCMRTKNYSPEQKEGMIRNHYKRKSFKYKVGPSSEDIWESRERRLEWGVAFSEQVEEPSGSDEEWNKRERLRREGQVEGTM